MRLLLRKLICYETVLVYFPNITFHRKRDLSHRSVLEKLEESSYPSTNVAPFSERTHHDLPPAHSSLVLPLSLPLPRGPFPRPCLNSRSFPIQDPVRREVA